MDLIEKNDDPDINKGKRDMNKQGIDMNSEEESARKKQKLNVTDEKDGEANVIEQQQANSNTIANRVDKSGNKICKHFVVKKNRLCKFSALKNLDYCVAHLAFNDQVCIFKAKLYTWLFCNRHNSNRLVIPINASCVHWTLSTVSTRRILSVI